MAKTWLKAAEENGIPAAFVVKEGKIAWIGHPMKLDDPLAKITAGDWDATALAKDRLVDKSKQRKSTAVNDKVFPPYRTGDFKAALAALEEATSGDAELADYFQGIKFACLCNSGATDDGLALGAKLLAANLEKAHQLNNDFWAVIDPKLKKCPDPACCPVGSQSRAARSTS